MIGSLVGLLFAGFPKPEKTPSLFVAALGLVSSFLYYLILLLLPPSSSSSLTTIHLPFTKHISSKYTLHILLAYQASLYSHTAPYFLFSLSYYLPFTPPF